MTPNTLNSAIENGYYISQINYSGNKQCRVDVKPQLYRNGMKAILSFWLSYKYVARNYPRAFEAANF